MAAGRAALEEPGERAGWAGVVTEAADVPASRAAVPTGCLRAASVWRERDVRHAAAAQAAAVAEPARGSCCGAALLGKSAAGRPPRDVRHANRRRSRRVTSAGRSRPEAGRAGTVQKAPGPAAAGGSARCPVRDRCPPHPSSRALYAGCRRGQSRLNLLGLSRDGYLDRPQVSTTPPPHRSRRWYAGFRAPAAAMSRSLRQFRIRGLSHRMATDLGRNLVLRPATRRW